MLPDYFYAKPRLENISDGSKNINKPLSWNPVPDSLFEFGSGCLGVATAYGWNYGFGKGAVPVPMYKGKTMLLC